MLQIHERKEGKPEKLFTGRKNTNTTFLWVSFTNTADSILAYINAIIYS